MKRFNYKKFEMQMRELEQDANRRCFLNKINEFENETYDINTRGRKLSIKIYYQSFYDNVDNCAVGDSFSLYATYDESGIVSMTGVIPVRGEHINDVIDYIRDVISGYIKTFRNQPEQIQWMERYLLANHIKANGITTKTRSL